MCMRLCVYAHMYLYAHHHYHCLHHRDHYYCDHYHMHRQFSINIPVVINTILRIFKAAAEDVPSVWRLHLGLGEDRRHKIL